MNSDVYVDVIGHGLIGQTLIAQVRKRGWQIKHVVKSDGVYRLDDREFLRLSDEPVEYLESRSMRTDLMFLAIPSANGGSAAMEYMRMYLEHSCCRIVTCEKAAFAHHFGYLKTYLNRIGLTASVGGGTRILKHLIDRKVAMRRQDVYLVLNATLNYVFWRISRDRLSIDEAIEAARRHGILEPGKSTPVEVFQAEVEDLVMKTVIIFNGGGYSPEILSPRSINGVAVFFKDLVEMMQKDASHSRWIVSITAFKPADEFLCGVKCLVDGWWVSIGLRKLARNPYYHRLVLPGPANALLIADSEDSDQCSFISGAGAGPRATVDSMMLDAENLLAKN